MKRNERGTAAAEAVYLIPGIVLIVAALVAGGRYWYLSAAVTEATHAAARAATYVGSSSAATRVSEAEARRQLSELSVNCRAARTSIDTSRFAVVDGKPGSVTVRITCDIGLEDLIVAGLPGSFTISATATSVVEPHRGAL